jgi:hypothetical protein
MEAAGLIEKIETGKALRFVTIQFHFTLSLLHFDLIHVSDSTLKISESCRRRSLPLIQSLSLIQAKKKIISMIIFLSVSSKPFFPCLPSLSLSHLASFNSSI